MENSNVGELMNITMQKIHEMVDANTVVGSPIATPDGITIIPVSRVSYAFASGGSDYRVKEKPGFGGGNGAGVKIEPIGFLVVKNNRIGIGIELNKELFANSSRANIKKYFKNKKIMEMDYEYGK